MAIFTQHAYNFISVKEFTWGHFLHIKTLYDQFVMQEEAEA